MATLNFVYKTAAPNQVIKVGELNATLIPGETSATFNGDVPSYVKPYQCRWDATNSVFLPGLGVLGDAPTAATDSDKMRAKITAYDLENLQPLNIVEQLNLGAAWYTGARADNTGEWIGKLATMMKNALLEEITVAEAEVFVSSIRDWTLSGTAYAPLNDCAETAEGDTDADKYKACALTVANLWQYELTINGSDFETGLATWYAVHNPVSDWASDLAQTSLYYFTFFGSGNAQGQGFAVNTGIAHTIYDDPITADTFLIQAGYV